MRKLVGTLTAATVGLASLAGCGATQQSEAQSDGEAAITQLVATMSELDALGRQYEQIPPLKSAKPSSVEQNAEKRVGLLAQISTVVDDLSNEVDYETTAVMPSLAYLPGAWNGWVRAESKTWDRSLQCTQKATDSLYAACMQKVIDDKNLSLNQDLSRQNLSRVIGDVNDDLADLKAMASSAGTG